MSALKTIICALWTAGDHVPTWKPNYTHRRCKICGAALGREGCGNV